MGFIDSKLLMLGFSLLFCLGFAIFVLREFKAVALIGLFRYRLSHVDYFVVWGFVKVDFFNFYLCRCINFPVIYLLVIWKVR